MSSPAWSLAHRHLVGDTSAELIAVAITPSRVAAVVGVVLAASILQRVSGFGFSLMATPLLGLAMPLSQAVVILSFVSIPSTTLTWRQLRAHADSRQVRRLIGWSVPGLPLGLLVHRVVPDRPIRIVLAVVILIAVGLLITGWKLPIRHVAVADGVAGFVSGVLNTSTGTNGPPLVFDLTSQNVSPDQLRATLSGVFAFSGIAAVVLFAIDGSLDADALVTGGAALPFALLGQFAGTRLAPHVSGATFRRLTFALLVATAFATAAKALRF